MGNDQWPQFSAAKIVQNTKSDPNKSRNQGADRKSTDENQRRFFLLSDHARPTNPVSSRPPRHSSQIARTAVTVDAGPANRSPVIWNMARVTRLTADTTVNAAHSDFRFISPSKSQFCFQRRSGSLYSGGPFKEASH